METVQTVDTQRIVTIQMTSGEYWLRLSLRMASAHLSGDLVQLASDAIVSIEPADEVCSAYRTETWMSAVISGALYAFRVLCVPRKRLFLEGLSGRLRSIDMDALANCSASAVALLVEMELPELDMESWVIETPVDNALAPPGPSRLAVS